MKAATQFVLIVTEVGWKYYFALPNLGLKPKRKSIKENPEPLQGSGLVDRHVSLYTHHSTSLHHEHPCVHVSQ